MADLHWLFGNGIIAALYSQKDEHTDNCLAELQLKFPMPPETILVWLQCGVFLLAAVSTHQTYGIATDEINIKNRVSSWHTSSVRRFGYFRIFCCRKLTLSALAVTARSLHQYPHVLRNPSCQLRPGSWRFFSHEQPVLPCEPQPFQQ